MSPFRCSEGRRRYWSLRVRVAARHLGAHLSPPPLCGVRALKGWPGNLSRGVATEQPTSRPKRPKTVKLTSARQTVKTLHLSLGRTVLCGRHDP